MPGHSFPRSSKVYKSVFIPIPDLQGYRSSGPILTPDHEPPMTFEDFIAIVDSVKAAIISNVQPTRIRQGSSGSYFCRDKDGNVVGVFKPKNEEPYGQLNPKWTKWIHRNLFPCFFGRSCLIPNLGYISEAAASLLDRQLQLNIVPRTEVVWISSPSFHYDYLDRRAARSKNHYKPLPEKIGSFQIFLSGYKDANIFLKEHPWPEFDDSIGNNGYSSQDNGVDDEYLNESYHSKKRFFWTKSLQIQFREQFEKLIILDYLMRNTDRGLDNWMVKYCDKDENDCIITSPPTKSMGMNVPKNLSKDNLLLNKNKSGSKTSLSENVQTPSSSSELQAPHNLNNSIKSDPLQPSSSGLSKMINESKLSLQQSQIKTTTTTASINSTCHSSDHSSKIVYPHIHVAAIDNGLAFPFKHPDQWRSYPYGWSFLSESLVGAPFTENTRKHFLSLLTDSKWWKDTISELHQFFSLDADFDDGMFSKQVAVLKGQGYNIVEILKQPDKSPLDLCASQNLMVWDMIESIEVPEEPDNMEGDNDNHQSDNIKIDNGGRNSLQNVDYGEASGIGGSVGTKYPNLPPRRSVSEYSSPRPSLSVSAPAASVLSGDSARKNTWVDRFNRVKNKFAFDTIGKNRDTEEKRTKLVVIEKIEPRQLVVLASTNSRNIIIKHNAKKFDTLSTTKITKTTVNPFGFYLSSSFLRSYSDAAALTRENIEARILDILKAFDKVDPSKVTTQARFADDLGLDSLDTVEVVMNIEEDFSIEIPDKEADEIRSVKDAVDYISKRDDAH
ncbi:7121_t:CDS:2 [Entrophospora sp. SA101]|nr:7121_t:CDS:2 [Entrophospora sp. SA101]